MIQSPFLARQERFDVVGSTNDVVRGWLADGVPEVCLAVADEQSAGRGREGRSWTAPAGRALLLSLGFRPTWLAPERVWRLAAVTSLAMADAAEDVASLKPGTIRLKWPNDLVVEEDGAVRKLAGVLGESDGLGTDDPRAVVGIGINADWPSDEFPPDLAPTMTSLHAAAGRRIDGDELLSAFLASLEPRMEALRAGAFDGDAWAERQLTNGHPVRLIAHDGREEVVRAIGVDPDSGALTVSDGEGERSVVTGEIQHLRLDRGV
jgi:BirA family transcriptional regulator, biotin operon repressor / biotin---[acetyl-CoA-carboxylase] ligase